MSEIRIPARALLLVALGGFSLGILFPAAGVASQPADPATDAAGTPALHFFPDRVYRAPFLADPAEPRLAGNALLNRSGVDARIGRVFPLLALGEEDGGTEAEISFEATAFLFLNRTSGNTFPLETFDGLVSAPIDIASGPWLFRTSFAHRSAHLADGSRDRRAFTYSREWIEATVARSWTRHRV